METEGNRMFEHCNRRSWSICLFGVVMIMTVFFWKINLVFNNTLEDESLVDVFLQDNENGNLRSKISKRGSGWKEAGISSATQGQLFVAERQKIYSGRRRHSDTDNMRMYHSTPTLYNLTEGQQLCSKWVVMTTIFPPTALTEQLVKMPGWCVVVVGDKKGPSTYDVPGDNGSSRLTYLTPAFQETLPYSIVPLLKWNHFGRKNIGYLYAVHHGAEYIYDTDDDNILKVNAAGQADIPLQATGIGKVAPETLELDSHVYNPYNSWRPASPGHGNEFMWPRGFPLDLIMNEYTQHPLSPVPAMPRAEVGVVTIVQSLADHDPDVDAIFRLTHNLPIEFQDRTPRSVVLPPKVLSPFNSQALLVSKSAFWGLLLPVTVHGRVSDIWRSYFTGRLLWDVGQRMSFTTPFVTQCRNAHSYLADFDAESDLYSRAGALCNALLEWQPEAHTLPGRIEELAILMYEMDILHEERDVKLYVAFLDDLFGVGYDFPLISESRDPQGFQSYPTGTTVRKGMVESGNACERASIASLSPWSPLTDGWVAEETVQMQRLAAVKVNTTQSMQEMGQLGLQKDAQSTRIAGPGEVLNMNLTAAPLQISGISTFTWDDTTELVIGIMTKLERREERAAIWKMLQALGPTIAIGSPMPAMLTASSATTIVPQDPCAWYKGTIPGSERVGNARYPVSLPSRCSRYLGVVGILSATPNSELRNAARKTWLNQLTGERPFHYRFLLDSSTESALEEQSTHNDILFLNATYHGRANKFGEKLYLWYKYAAHHFPEAAFVTKMDDDAYICPDLDIVDIIMKNMAPQLYMAPFHFPKIPYKPSHQYARNMNSMPESWRPPKVQDKISKVPNVNLAKQSRRKWLHYMSTACVRGDELFVTIGMGVARYVASQQYCNDFNTCNLENDLLDTNFGGTSLAAWLRPLGPRLHVLDIGAVVGEYSKGNMSAFHGCSVIIHPVKSSDVFEQLPVASWTTPRLYSKQMKSDTD